MEDDNQEINWQAPEFEYQYKDVGWYWFTVIGTAILFLIAFWQKNILFGAFVIIAEAMLIFWAKEQPRIIKFTVNKKGLGIGNKDFYGYENLRGFHIHERGYNNELIIKTKNRLHPYLFILVSAKDAVVITEFLKKYLPQMEYDESLSESLFRIIKF